MSMTKRFTVMRTKRVAGSVVPVHAETIGNYDKLVEAGRALIALGPDALDSVEVIDNRKMREVRVEAYTKAKYG